MSVRVLCLAATVVSAVWDDSTKTLSAKSSEPIKYVTLSSPRSGSGWFRSMIVSHEHVSDTREVFAKNFGFFRHAAENCLPESKNFRAHAEAFLKSTAHIPDNSTQVGKYWKQACDLMSHFNNGDFEVTGFKWMMDQGLESVYSEAVEYFNENNYKVFILERKNLLRHTISIFGLRNSPQGTAHLTHPDKSIMDTKLSITPKDFIKMFKVHEIYSKKYDAIEAAGNNVMRISYEELAAEPSETIQRAYEFLGIDPQPVSTDHFLKTHTGSIDQLVKDWKSVRAELMKTEYAEKIEAWERELYFSQNLNLVLHVAKEKEEKGISCFQ
mmetsp:Transcript_28812/g.50703  ORF Transcript_28812/g.50703 Transcript_28812/m.50703 type:complete len:326 (+) Transcript_28812:34-1011(+)